MKPLRNLLLIVTAIVFLLSLTACVNNAVNVLKETVDEINSDESMHAELEGLYAVRAEVRGDSAVVVIFRAELEELASPEVSKVISESVSSEFQLAVDEIRKAGISDPMVILEFQDLGGNLIYTHVFS